jgi:hypothetical protein
MGSQPEARRFTSCPRHWSEGPETLRFRALLRSLVEVLAVHRERTAGRRSGSWRLLSDRRCVPELLFGVSWERQTATAARARVAVTAGSRSSSASA